MLRTLASLLRTRPPDADDARLKALETHVKALYERYDDLLREETRRAAEHHAMLDRLERLYKRITARIARGSDSAEETGESVLTLRQRLGR